MRTMSVGDWVRIVTTCRVGEIVAIQNGPCPYEVLVANGGGVLRFRGSDLAPYEDVDPPPLEHGAPAMSETQHTPGPWAAHLAYNRWRIYEPHGPMVQDALGKRVPRGVAFALRAGGREEANARLIASAPETYRALDNLLTEIGDGDALKLPDPVKHRNGRIDIDASSANREHNEQVANAIAEARAAIAKATGQE